MPFLINAQNIKIDSLCNLDQHDLSLVFLEKEVFEAHTQQEKNVALLKKAYCNKHTEKFKEATETLERTVPAASDDSIRFLIGYELAINYYLHQNYTKSLLSIIQLKNSIDSSELLNKVIYLEILLAHENLNWDKAYSLTNEMGFSDPIFNDSINTLYSNIKKMKLKDPEKAENLSYFIPGAGQIYAGKVFRGITSLVIQSGLLGFAGYSFLNGYYFSGTFTGVSLFYVFYMGGARHAGYLADEYNKKVIKENRGKIENYLLEQIKKEAL